MKETAGIRKTTGAGTLGGEGKVSLGKDDQVFESGAWAGRKQAFAEVAGRCSAGRAEGAKKGRRKEPVRQEDHDRVRRPYWLGGCQRRIAWTKTSLRPAAGGGTMLPSTGAPSTLRLTLRPGPARRMEMR